MAKQGSYGKGGASKGKKDMLEEAFLPPKPKPKKKDQRVGDAKVWLKKRGEYEKETEKAFWKSK